MIKYSYEKRRIVRQFKISKKKLNIETGERESEGSIGTGKRRCQGKKHEKKNRKPPKKC